jgi:hypothetical protein
MADDQNEGAVASAVTVATDAVSRLHTRLAQTRLVTWILFEGPRWLVSLALLTAVFAAFLVFALVRPVDMRSLLSDTTTLQDLFTALLSGAILIVSIVSSISSIVLSQEITDIETERDRLDASIDFRRRTENLANVEGSPTQPAQFLEVILYTIYVRTQELSHIAAKSDDPDFADQTEEFADEILSEAKNAATTLDGARFGTFKVLQAGLHYDYSWQLTTARRIRNHYADQLTDEEEEVLTNLIDTLKFFATGREYFQSLYYKREVARLSKLLLYVSLPVIVVISYLLLALDTTLVPDVRVGPLSALPVLILFAYTVSLAPYVVLTSFVLRVAAITMRTLAVGPFIIRQRDHQDIVALDMQTDPSEWDTDLDVSDASETAGSGGDGGEAPLSTDDENETNDDGEVDFDGDDGASDSDDEGTETRA